MNEYELLRQATIKANHELLLSLGLASGVAPSIVAASSKGVRASASGRKALVKGITKSNVKAAAVEPTRRSERARNLSGSNPSSTSSSPSSTRLHPRSTYDFIDDSPIPSRSYNSSPPQRIQKSALSYRIHDPKTIGSIPGVEVGRWWEFRAGASRDAIHAPLVAGISGSPLTGCYSICFSSSSSYADNADRGSSFTFTGCGGRALRGTKSQPKNLRTAPQSFDQDWSGLNGSLRVSFERKKVVRVLRGWRTDCDWAPVSGYRYDGLYIVTSAELVTSPMTGFTSLQRVPGQRPIPKRSDTPGVDVNVDALRTNFAGASAAGEAEQEMMDVNVITETLDAEEEDEEEDIPLAQAFLQTPLRKPVGQRHNPFPATPSLTGSSSASVSDGGSSGADSPFPRTPARGTSDSGSTCSDAERAELPVIIARAGDAAEEEEAMAFIAPKAAVRRSARSSPGEKRYARPFYKSYLEAEQTPSKGAGTRGVGVMRTSSGGIERMVAVADAAVDQAGDFGEGEMATGQSSTGSARTLVARKAKVAIGSAAKLTEKSAWAGKRSTTLKRCSKATEIAKRPRMILEGVILPSRRS